MKRLLLLLSFSLSSNCFAEKVCMVTDMYDKYSMQEPATSDLLKRYGSVCTINVRVKDRSQYEKDLIIQKIISDIKQIKPSLVYSPQEYYSQLKNNLNQNSISVVGYGLLEEEMVKDFFCLVKEFAFDFNSFVILYDDSTFGRKRFWERQFKERKFNVTSIRVASKRDLLKALNKIQASKKEFQPTRGIILNLMVDVKDVEYNRRLSYEEIKEELQSRNYKFLTIGVERSRRFNEGVVFDVNPISNKIEVLINKKAFDKLGWSHLYLDNTWETLGGFIYE